MECHIWCWKFDKSQLNECHIKETVKNGGGNIMIWGMGGVRTRSGRRAYTGWHVPDVPTIDLKIHLKSSLSRVRPIWSVC